MWHGYIRNCGFQAIEVGSLLVAIKDFIDAFTTEVQSYN